MHEAGQLLIQIKFWILLDMRDPSYLYQILVQLWLGDFIAKGKQLELTAEVLGLSKPFIYSKVAEKSFLQERKALERVAAWEK